MIPRLITPFKTAGFVFVAAAVFVVALGVSPATAVNCQKNPDHRNCGGSGGGGGEGNGDLLLEALLAGEVPPGLPIGSDACDTSGAVVGPFDDPDTTDLMNEEFDRLVDTFDAVLPAPNSFPTDQLFGFGKGTLDADNGDLILVQLQNSGAGLGAVNRVQLPGPPDRQGNQDCGDANDAWTHHGGVWLVVGRGPDCEEAGEICVTGYMVRAELNHNNLGVVGKNEAGNDVINIDPVELHTAACEATIVDMGRRFDMVRGRKNVNYGTLSFGRLHFRVLPEDQICPQ